MSSKITSSSLGKSPRSSDNLLKRLFGEGAPMTDQDFSTIELEYEQNPYVKAKVDLFFQ